MIDVQSSVARAKHELGENSFILAAPFEIGRSLAERLTEEGRIAGYVADGPRTGLAVAGNWVDERRSCWRLRRGKSSAILFLGAEAQVGGRMLLEAFLAGVREIVLPTPAGGAVVRLPVISTFARRLTGVLITQIGNHVGERAANIVRRRTYEQAFEEFYKQAGSTFRVGSDRVVTDRVLLIVGSLGPGGAERQVATTARGLAQRSDWRPIVGVSRLADGGDFHHAALQAARVPVETVSINPACLHDDVCRGILASARQYGPDGFDQVAHIILSYADFIAERRPAIVHCWMDYCNVLAGIAADLAGVPALVLSGRSMAPDHFDLHQPYMLPGYRALLAGRPNVVFTNNSRAGAADYARWLGVERDRFIVIHNGFDFPAPSSARAQQNLRTSLGIPNGAPVMGTIIRFSEEKQPFLWIEVATEVLKRVPGCYCVAFGGGQLLDEARKRIHQRGTVDRIKFPGITKDPWTALAIMDVFLLTSRMEGLPNVLVEAQATGVPVVTTGKGGMVETYIDGDTGLTERSQRAGPIADAVATLLQEPTRLSRMSYQARAHAHSRFGSDVMLQATLLAYKNAANAHKQ